MFGVAGLEHVASGSGAHGLDHELAIVVGRQHDHADLGELLPDLASRLQAIHLRHADVQENDVRRGLLHEPQGFLAVRGLAHDLDVLCRVEVAAQALADEGMVVRDRDLDGHDPLLRLGGRLRL